MLAAICNRRGIAVGVKLPAAGVQPVQRWRGELGAEFGWLLPGQSVLIRLIATVRERATGSRQVSAGSRQTRRSTATTLPKILASSPTMGV